MVEIKNLSKYYGDFQAVNDISFGLSDGEVLGFLGPNGAGKTTTLRILTGYLEPSAGHVYIAGKDISKHPLESKRLIGYLPESSPLYPDMLCYDFLDYSADMRQITTREKNSRIKELCDLCGINEVMHKTVSQISKGYKQRVGLAYAMMNNPQILVLDEPTAGLDPNQIAEILALIREIGRSKTVILSSHILSEIENSCDRALIINKGKIVADGKLSDLKKQDDSTTLLHLSLKTKVAEKTLRSKLDIKGVHSLDFQKIEGDWQINIHAQEDLRAPLYQVIKMENWVLLEFSQQQTSLENVFKQFTQEAEALPQGGINHEF